MSAKDIEFLNNLTQLIKSTGLSKRQFAIKADVKYPTLMNCFKRKTILGRDNLLKIQATYGVSMGKLLGAPLPVSSQPADDSANASLPDGAVPDETRDSINRGLLLLDKLKDPPKVQNIMQIVEISSGLPADKVDMLLKVAEAFKSENRS